MVTLGGIPVTLQIGIAIVLFGGWIGLFQVVLMLFRGRIGTYREMKEKNARVETLEAALASRDAQIKEALSVLPEVSEVLRKFHAAAEISKSGDS